MAGNNFNTTVSALFQGMDGVVSSKTVVGDAIHIGDIIILPLVDVSFAIGAGAFSGDKKENSNSSFDHKITFYYLFFKIWIDIHIFLIDRIKDT